MNSTTRDLSKYRKDLVETAEVICSCLNEEELKALEFRANKKVINFKEQILLKYVNKYPRHSLEKTKQFAESLIKNFQPFFKLKDDNCGINKILLDRFDKILFEHERGFYDQVDQELREGIEKSLGSWGNS